MIDPASAAAVLGKPVSSFATELARSRTWALRTALQAFSGQPSPRPRRALARWLGTERIVEAVLAAPVVPRGAGDDLDAALCRAHRGWRAQPAAVRAERAEQLVAASHKAVLSVRGGGWATRLASARQAADAAHNRRQSADITDGIRQILARTDAAPGGGSDRLRLDARLAMLPPALRLPAARAWEEAPAETARLVNAVTDPDCPPKLTVQQWEPPVPGWLRGAPPRVLTLAGEIAATYAALSAARELFLTAVRAGATRPSYWAARAAMLHDPDERDLARQELAAGGDPDSSVEPLARALDLVLAEDWDGARERLSRWRPDDTTGWALWWALRHRVAMLSRSGGRIDGPMLDETLAAADQALAGAGSLGPVPTGLAVRTAQFLVLRAQLGAADRPAGDLRRAQELAVRARDDRRAWRGDSAEAVEWVCAAAFAGGDYRRVVELGSTDGQATDEEAASPAVRRHVVAARAALGGRDAPDTDGMDEYDKQSLLALHAMTGGQDPAPNWRAALASARDDSERVTALAGLARAGGTDLTGLEDIEAQFPDVAGHVRALADAAAGDYTSAIARLRGPATTSPTAAMTLADAYARAGRPDDAVATLQQAAERFSDPDLALAAVRLLFRTGTPAEARTAADALLAAAPDGWSGRPEALQLAAQLAVDAGDPARAVPLLKTSVELDPWDAPARWALARLLLGRGKDDDARRVIAEHPEPLRPTEPDHAHAWINAHRRHLPAAALARGAVALARQFPDSETVAAHAIIALVMPRNAEDEPLPEDLLGDIHAVQRDFFDRWPDSKHLRAVTVDPDDPAQAIEQLQRMVAVDDDTARARREFHRRVARTQLPLGALSDAARRSHAAVVLARGLGTIPAWHPDPAEHTAAASDAAEALDGPAVADTTTLLVLTLLGESLRGTLLGAFTSVRITDSTLSDIRRAADEAAARSTASFVYDDQARRTVLVEGTEQDAEDRAAESQALVRVAAVLPAFPDPPVDPDDPTRGDWGPWMAAARAAASGGALWSDDAALRVLARALGAKAFSTAAVLDALLARGVLSLPERDDALRRMVRGRIGGIPHTADGLRAAAEDGSWDAGPAALVLADPAVWADPNRGLELLDAVLPSVARHRPAAAAGWAFAAARGIGHAHDDEDLAARIAGTALAAIVHRLGSAPDTAATAVGAVRSGLASASPDPDVVPDPLPLAAASLMRALSRALDPATAAQYVLALFSGLGDTDRTAVARAVLAP